RRHGMDVRAPHCPEREAARRRGRDPAQRPPPVLAGDLRQRDPVAAIDRIVSDRELPRVVQPPERPVPSGQDPPDGVVAEGYRREPDEETPPIDAPGEQHRRDGYGVLRLEKTRARPHPPPP